MVYYIADYIGKEANLFRKDLPSKQTLRKNCLWIALSLYYHDNPITLDESRYDLIVSNIKSVISDPTQILNFEINSGIPNRKALGIIISSLYNIGDYVGWNDLADPGLSKNRYEEAAQYILEKNGYNNTPLICYGEKPERTVSEFFDENKEIFENGVLINEGDYDTVSQLIVDSMTLNLKHFPAIFGDSDVTDLYLPTITESGIKFSSNYGSLEHSMNRLPEDGSIKIDKVYRDIHDGSYYFTLSEESDIDVIKKHLKKSFKKEMVSAGTNPLELKENILEDIKDSLDRVNINFLKIRKIASEPSDTLIVRLDEYPEVKNPKKYYFLGKDDKIIPLSHENTTDNMLEFVYFGPEGKDIIEQIDDKGSIELVIHELPFYPDGSTIPNPGNILKIVFANNSNEIKAKIEMNSVFNKSKSRRYLHEYLNTVHVAAHPPVEEGSRNPTHGIFLSLMTINSSNGNILRTLIHESLHDFDDGRWKRDYDDIEIQKKLLKEKIKTFRDKEDANKSLKITVTEDGITYSDKEREEDWKEALRKVNETDLEFSDFWGQFENFKDLTYDVSRPVREYIYKHFAYHQMDEDLLNHYAGTVFWREYIGPNSAMFFGYASEIGSGIKKAYVEIFYRVGLIGDRGNLAGFSSSDIAANLAGAYGYSFEEALDAGILKHDEDVTYKENYFIGQGTFENFIEKYNRLMLDEDMYKSITGFKKEKKEVIVPKKVYRETTLGDATEIIKSLDGLGKYGITDKDYFLNEFMARALSIMAMKNDLSFLDIYEMMKIRYPGFSMSPESINILEREFTKMLGRIPRVFSKKIYTTDAYTTFFNEVIQVLPYLVYKILLRKYADPNTFDVEGFKKYSEWWIDAVGFLESNRNVNKENVKHNASVKDQDKVYGAMHFKVESFVQAVGEYWVINSRGTGYPPPTWILDMKNKWDTNLNKRAFRSYKEYTTFIDTLSYHQQMAIGLVYNIQGKGKDTDWAILANADNDPVAAVQAARKLYIEGHMRGTWPTNDPNIIANMDRIFTVEEIIKYK
jgi:hypothetical protein